MRHKNNRRKMSHIINPVVTDSASDLCFAQPITFKTMQTAQTICSHDVCATLYSAQYPEDRPMVPDGFIQTRDLDQSVLDYGTFERPKKLPLIKDIIDRLYQSSSDDYMIYTNVDIALQPFFYQAVNRIIERGYDAFVINRRTISDQYTGTDQIPLMYAQVGEKHPGWDCFVFHRDLYPRFDLGTACIGAGWIGRVMISNMACLARKFMVFTDLHLTFHIGRPKVHRESVFDDYRYMNRKECRRILAGFEKRYGIMDRSKLPGKFLNFMKKDKHIYTRFENRDREK